MLPKTDIEKQLLEKLLEEPSNKLFSPSNYNSNSPTNLKATNLLKKLFLDDIINEPDATNLLNVFPNTTLEQEIDNKMAEHNSLPKEKTKNSFFSKPIVLVDKILERMGSKVNS